jgi:hypothetical protein
MATPPAQLEPADEPTRSHPPPTGVQPPPQTAEPGKASVAAQPTATPHGSTEDDTTRPADRSAEAPPTKTPEEQGQAQPEPGQHEQLAETVDEITELVETVVPSLQDSVEDLAGAVTDTVSPAQLPPLPGQPDVSQPETPPLPDLGQGTDATQQLPEDLPLLP